LAEPKELVKSAIASALANLDEALAELEKIPAFDAGSVAFAAHALNNYLAVIAGALELVLMRLEDHPDDQLRIWLEGAQHATNLMTRLVGQLTNTAAPADAPFRIEAFDLTTLVQRACSFYQRVADRKASRVDVNSAAGVPPVWADRVAAAAILDNLVSNAIKYSPPGATVQVQVRAEGDWVVCSVRDSGPGLSPEDQARLFRRGARLTPKPTAGEPSMGYGLAVAKELVEGLGGQIWCESAVGQGSCFSFRLPAHREKAQDTVPAPGNSTSAESGKADPAPS
jgi:signal transduction histidine kinase